MAVSAHHAVDFNHRWATRICPENPWYRRSANRVIEVTLSVDTLLSRPILPMLSPGFPEVRIPISKIVGIERTSYRIPGIGIVIPTVTVHYLDETGRKQSLEHIFTTIGPFSLVTSPHRRQEEFIAALEARRDSWAVE